MDVLPTRVYMRHVCACAHKGRKWASQVPGTGVSDSCRPLRECWELNLIKFCKLTCNNQSSVVKVSSQLVEFCQVNTYIIYVKGLER